MSTETDTPRLFDAATCNELAKEVLEMMSDDMKAELRQMKEYELWHTRFGIGSWIRNAWFYGAPHTWTSLSPDDDSMRVVKAVWQRLQIMRSYR